ncbi:YIP1 family protein [Paracidobacterium acidisoli]|uniref:Yip1 domain-containing protein n=1 Tax=Paracidobacterium acidisoli TaxID=2303751 RepID=A0A372IQ02_9BACT|nr:YIP1 family protein [Paracidobacterium acidisoli]MBT9331130.1 YIP1 family protein [Paracidobacterium acidisoli]
MTDIHAATIPEGTRLSEGQRIVDTFTAPSKTFTDILRSSAWWGPFLVLLIVSIGFSFAVQQKVGWARVFESNLHQSPKQEERFAQMPAEQAANAKALGQKITAVIAYSYSVVVLIITVVSALLIWVTVNFGFGGTSKFGQIYAVSMYATLVMNIKYLLAIVALFAGLAPDSFTLQNPVGTNLGYYLSSDLPRWLTLLCTHIDLFEIWSVILSTIGVAVVAKVSRGKAAAAVFGWWIILVLLSVVLAS